MLAKIVIKQGEKLIAQSKEIETLRKDNEKNNDLIIRIKNIAEKSDKYNNTEIALEKIKELVNDFEDNFTNSKNI
jgi:hypothetical protein